MKHDHSFAPAADTGHRCRLCTANDLDGLVEEIAEQIWESHRDAVLQDPPWAEASVSWQTTIRGYAQSMVDILRAKA
ncbi:MAG: hypothetical protein FJ335_10715 [Sphingomonadales bacterium]|nr:hypothetical protein [Sphingomonadales bacterium]